MLVVLGLVIGECFIIWFFFSGLVVVVYLCVFGLIVVFIVYVWLLYNVCLVLVVSYVYVNLVIVVILGVIIGNEYFGSYDLLVMVVILVGVVVLIFVWMCVK